MLVNALSLVEYRHFNYYRGLGNNNGFHCVVQGSYYNRHTQRFLGNPANLPIISDFDINTLMDCKDKISA